MYITFYDLFVDTIISPHRKNVFSGEYNEIEVFHNGDDATISNLDINTEYVFSIKVNTAQGPGKSSKPLICKTSESRKIFEEHTLLFTFTLFSLNIYNLSIK